MVYYRKYRPQTIEELDSARVREKLHAVLSTKDVSHAFLLTGPKGLGKTSTARIVAKVINCERKNQKSLDLAQDKSGIMNKGKGQDKRRKKNETHDSSFIIHNSQTIEPCNKCSQCVSITNGTNLDILEIDGASNRGIDEIRDLREKVRLSAARASRKVYIIDEVHMLTQEAFNALLKTLEEPPPHVIFILCTTEPHKLPQTIVSRCFHVSFNKAGVEELVRSFKRIAKKEKLDIDDETLSLIASLSDGSFRDGAKILEEIALESKGAKITKEILEQNYQVLSIKHQVSQMLKLLSDKNSKEGMKLTSKLIEKGVDIKYFIEQLILELHQMLLVEVGITDSSKFKVQSSKFAIEEIKELVELLSKAYADLKYAVLPELPLEMVIVEWGESKRHSGNQSGMSLIEYPESPDTKRDSGQARMTGTDNFWQELINKVKSHNHSIAAVLRGCKLKEYDGENLVIEAKYKFHKDKLDSVETIAFIEKVCQEIAKNKVKVSILLKSS